jgi:predicted NBD/HSP70 family sugar kinase
MRTGRSHSLSRSEVAVLEAIRQRGRASRRDVATKVGLGAPMPGRVVGRPLGAGLIQETGRAAANGQGRRSGLLEVRPDVADVAGVDIGTEVVHLLVADLHGAVRAYREVSSGVLAHLTQHEIIVTLADLVRAVSEEGSIPPARVAAVGISVTGIIDSDAGVCVVRSNTPGWENVPLVAQLGAAIAKPVLLEETARAKAVAELRLGAAQVARHFLYVDAGTAIGAGLVIDGQPFRGVCGLAGELGHITVDPLGALCCCGNRGCIQATTSARALVRQARDLLQQGVYSSLSGRGEGLTLADIAAAASEGDKLALSLLTEAGERLGEAMSMALNLLGLDRVIVGGALAHCHPLVLAAAARTVRLRVLPMVQRERVVMRSTLGQDIAARGVVLQAIDWLFGDPAERLLRVHNEGDGLAPETAVAAG